MQIKQSTFHLIFLAIGYYFEEKMSPSTGTQLGFGTALAMACDSFTKALLNLTLSKQAKRFIAHFRVNPRFL